MRSNAKKIHPQGTALNHIAEELARLTSWISELLQAIDYWIFTLYSILEYR